MPDVFFQKWDEKAINWGLALKKHGVSADGLLGSPICAPVILWKMVMKGSRPAAFVFRYLNDYGSLGKTMIRMASEALVILTSRLNGVKIFWILHNIDAESEQHWPTLTWLRREMLHRCCDNAYVIDPLLVDRATKKYPRVRWKSLPYGISANRKSAGTVEQRILDLCGELRASLSKRSDVPVYIGLCVTSMSKKCAHLFRYKELLQAAEEQGCVVGLLFVGDFAGGGDKWIELRSNLSKNGSVRILDVRAHVDEERIANDFDFVYRSLTDLSVPYSIYRAAAMGKPVVTHDVGFCAELVRHHKIGIVVAPASVEDFTSFFGSWSEKGWLKFTKYRSWDCAAKQIASDVSE